MYNRASADLKGNPWSERKRWVWWDPSFVNPPDPKTGKPVPRVGGLGRAEVGHVVPHPLAARHGLAGLRVGRVHKARIPPHPSLALAPRVALQVGRRAVVHDAAVGGPGPTPLEVRSRHARRIGFAPRREVLIPGW